MPTAQDALAYAGAGIPVFPLAGKRPIEQPGTENVDGAIIPQGRSGFHQATIDPAKIERWWAAYPDANIGTPTGHHLDAISGQRNGTPFDVFDVDIGHGGLDSLSQLSAIHGAFPETPWQITGTGGQHWCFASTGSVRNSAGGIAPGIDIRGTGGYIVVAPSIHPQSLAPYVWQIDPAKAPLAPMPEWLLSLIRDVSRKRSGTQTGARIPLGVQEATLTRIAGAMRRHGSTKSEILAALRVVSQERCDPQVSDRDLERIATSMSNYEPGEALLDFPLDDGGNAERLVNRYGESVRHVADSNAAKGDGWHYYDGRVWQRSGSRIIQYQLETARAYQDATEAIIVPEGDAATLERKRAHTKNAKHCANERGLTAMRKLAASFPDIEIQRTELDADPWSFAVANGVLDLRTGALRDSSPADLISRASPVAYDPDARHPLWFDFLRWFTRERPELERFLQMAAGYTMTADVREEKLFFIHGPAASGKTSFVEAVKVVMGGYATTADFSTFLKGHAVGGPRQDIARLSGARYVSSIEVDQGKRLAEGLVKQLTGGDTVTARFLYGTEFEFSATHKLWLVANDAPKVNSEDSGLWRRILRIPCDNVVPEGQRDATLKPRLKDPIELGPTILTWMLEGCMLWQQAGGLDVPDTIKEATEDYRESQDPITDFLAEACEINKAVKVLFGDLWSAYLAYCKQYHRTPMGKRDFGDRLEARGFSRGRTGAGRFIQGLTLAASDFS